MEVEKLSHLCVQHFVPPGIHSTPPNQKEANYNRMFRSGKLTYSISGWKTLAVYCTLQIKSARRGQTSVYASLV